MENYVTYLIIGGIFVLFANGYRLRKKRTTDLKLEAERIGLAFEDIDIDTYPNFLKEYSLTGEDEKRIRNMFNSELLSALEQHKHICLEGYKNMLIYYSFKRSLLHLGRLCKPKNIECFLQKAESIHAVMAYSDKAQL